MRAAKAYPLARSHANAKKPSHMFKQEFKNWQQAWAVHGASRVVSTPEGRVENSLVNDDEDDAPNVYSNMLCVARDTAASYMYIYKIIL